MSSLSEYGAARDELLDRLIRVIGDDSRVVAVWLSGSLGRGEGDDWADCDLSIVIDDGSLASFLADRSKLYDSLGEVLLLQDEIPGQPDVGDVFNLVYFESPHGPIELDLSFVPFSSARKPVGFRLLFERRMVPTALPSVLAKENIHEYARRWTKFFWAMAPIAVKFAGRGDTRRGATQIDLLTRALIALWRLLEEPEPVNPWQPDENRPLEEKLNMRLPILPQVISPLAVLDHIVRLCDEAEALQPALANLGAAAKPGIITGTRRLAELAREEIHAGPPPRANYR